MTGKVAAGGPGMLRWVRMAARPMLLLAALVLAGVALRWVGLDRAIEHGGDRGPVVFTALGALACAVGVPRQVVAYAGGLAFGFWPGALLALVAETVGCAITFYWSRLVARRWAAGFLERSAARGGRLGRLERFLVVNAFSSTLTLRLLPVGSNIGLTLLAGVSGVRAVPFVLASAIGYVPQTVVFALLGGGVRVSQTEQIWLSVGLLAASIGLGVWLLRKGRVASLEVG